MIRTLKHTTVLKNGIEQKGNDCQTNDKRY